MNIEDIARKAGVSRSTVSRVLNNDPKVRRETREHVWKVIHEEDFHPNPSARALVRQQTETIGVMIPTTENIFFTDNNYFTRLLAGINQKTRDAGYAMLLWLGELATDDEKLMGKITNKQRSDGLIAASVPLIHPFFNRLLTLTNPLVLIDRPLKHGDRLNHVSIDNIQGAELATEHLIRLGRRRIAHITGHMSISDAVERLEGYKNALTKAGYPIDPNLIVEAFFSRQHGYEATKRLLSYHPDAIVAASDTVAAGVLAAANEAGLRVPDDLAIVGFDDDDVATQTFPLLTTVRQPVEEKGAAAVELLLDIIEHRVVPPQHRRLTTELIIRQSCGANLAQPVS